MITDLSNISVGDLVVLRRHINNTKLVDTVDHIWEKHIKHRTEDRCIGVIKIMLLSETGIEINMRTGVEIDAYNKPHFSVI